MAADIRFRGQVEIADCGASCLGMVLAYFGKKVPFDELRDVTGTGRDGTNARTLLDAGSYYGLSGRGVRVDRHEVRNLPAGSILHWSDAHFVVVGRPSRRGLRLVDPALGVRLISWAELPEDFSTVALLLEPDADFVRTNERRPTVWHYLRPLLQQHGVLRRVLIVSVLIRLLSLGVPLLTAVLVDRVVPTGDRHLLLVLAACLAVTVVFQFVNSWLRSRLLLRLRTRLDERMTLAFVEHLVKLPYVFHLRRSSGDMMARLRSNTVVRELLTTGAMSALLDGALAVIYLILLVVLSPTLTVIVAGLAALQIAGLVASRKATQRLATENLQAEAMSQGYAFQMLAGIGTIKSSGAEDDAVSRFAELFRSELAVVHDRGRLSSLVDALLSTLALAAPMVVLVTAGVQVLAGDLSLGTALAINALAAGFLTPLNGLVNTALSLQVLAGYFHRLDDVFQSKREQEGQDVVHAPALTGEVDVVNVSFRYAPLSPLALREVSLHIEPGEKVALVGRSGSGKTTLANLVLGLYEPTHGEVRHDGMNVAGLDVGSVRRQLGVVTQSPYLFGGSIKENISFMRPDMSMSVIVEAARRARLADDIAKMPMGYDTVVGDGGSLLSGGQRQRMALARAFAADPRLLLLDEATSNLDAVTEAEVYRELATTDATIIIVAHRLSTIGWADTIVVVDEGRVVERGTHDELLRCGGYYRELVMAQLGGPPPPLAIVN